MKNRLWIKLALSFTLVILASGSVTLVVLRQAIRREFQSYVQRGDIETARGLAPVLGEYYRENRSWDGVKSILPGIRQDQTVSEPPRSGPWGRMGSPPRNPAGGGRHTHQTPPAPQTPEHPRNPAQSPGLGANARNRYVVIDTQGLVRGDSAGIYGDGAKAAFPAAQGVPIFSGENIQEGESPVGYILAGSMVDPLFGELENNFIGQLNRVMLLVILFTVLLSLVLSFFLVGHVTRPLERMEAVSGRISRGDFSARVGLDRKDELGELARGLDQMAGSLEESENWKRRIIADSAHELRTPAALIQGTLEMLLDGIYPLDRERIQVLYDESRHLSALIAELQELASLEARDKPLEKSEVDLAAVIGEAAGSFDAFLEETENPPIEIHGEGIRVWGDPGKLKRVFVNLFSNALKHIPRKTGWIKVSLRTGASRASGASGAVVYVDNNGPAIPPEKREAIFERFYRLEDSRNRDEGGRGLGLAICREILRAHGGEIRVEDLPEGPAGVRFAVYLPLDRPAD